MRRMPWFAYVWPGFAQLWSYGSWAGLALALGTAVVLDVLLLVSFGWSELIEPALRNGLWAGLGAFWVIAAAWSVQDVRRRAATVKVDDKGQDAFAETLELYLQGDYYQTELRLLELLRHNERDLDARLMLATLHRHTGRPNDAAVQLDILERFEGAEKWEHEILREREFLKKSKLLTATAA